MWIRARGPFHLVSNQTASSLRLAAAPPQSSQRRPIRCASNDHHDQHLEFLACTSSRPPSWAPSSFRPARLGRYSHTHTGTCAVSHGYRLHKARLPNLCCPSRSWLCFLLLMGVRHAICPLHAATILGTSCVPGFTLIPPGGHGAVSAMHCLKISLTQCEAEQSSTREIGDFGPLLWRLLL